MDFEAQSLEALTVSCEKNLKAKRLILEAKQKDLEKMNDVVREFNSQITEHLAKIFGGLMSR